MGCGKLEYGRGLRWSGFNLVLEQGRDLMRVWLRARQPGGALGHLIRRVTGTCYFPTISSALCSAWPLRQLKVTQTFYDGETDSFLSILYKSHLCLSPPLPVTGCSHVSISKCLRLKYNFCLANQSDCSRQNLTLSACRGNNFVRSVYKPLSWLQCMSPKCCVTRECIFL